jgi:small subunit ribosomal protein S17
MTDQQNRNTRQVIQGIVSSDKTNKTITVTVERTFKHPKYKKYIRRHSKVYAHDEENAAQVGDTVEIMECRPLSKTKRWRLIKVTSRATLTGGGLT